MSIVDTIEISKALHPKGGVRLPPAACRFILADLEEILSDYEGYLAELIEKGQGPNAIGVLMAKNHIAGIRYIVDAVRGGMANKEE